MSTTEPTPTAVPSPTPKRKPRSKFRSAPEIARLAPGDYSDAGCRGLTVRVTANGARSFRWRIRGAGRLITLGEWALEPTPGRLTLHEARQQIDVLRTAWRVGQLEARLADLDTRLGRRRPAAAQSLGAEAPLTVSAVCEEFYLRRCLPHRKRPLAARRLLDREIIPALGDRPIGEVAARDVVRVVQAIVDRPSPATAQKVLTLLKTMFRFAEARSMVGRNPATALSPRDLGILPGIRQRALDAAEIVVLWKALDAEPTELRSLNHHKANESRAVRLALKVLLLTGARVGELCLAKWENVDLKAATWTIPVADQKATLRQAQTARPFVVPLSPTALGLLRELKDLAGESPWVMASEWASGGHVTRAGPAHVLTRILAEAPLPGGPVVVHDLRRTLRTGLGRLRVSFEIRERCLNHSVGRLVETYDVGDYLPERREALELWDRYIGRLLAGEDAEVVALQTRPGSAP